MHRALVVLGALASGCYATVTDTEARRDAGAIDAGVAEVFVEDARDVPIEDRRGAGDVFDAPTDIAADVAPDAPPDTGPFETVSAPRPLTPPSLADVSVLRPTFRWAPSVDSDGAVVELCRDRACTTVIETLRATGVSARPSADLPPRSVVFWRLRGRRGAAEGVGFSPVWLLHTPARSAPRELYGAAHLDVNADGFDDAVIGSLMASAGGREAAGRVSLFLGSRLGLEAVPTRVFEGRVAYDELGNSVACAGDVNGDGFADVVVGAALDDPGRRMNAGSASVYHGNAESLDRAPARVLEGVAVEDEFGKAVSGAGDVNGDGYADIVVGAFHANPGGRTDAGTASVFHGGAGGIGGAPSVVLEGGAAQEILGFSVASAGDVNGDGFADLVVGGFEAAPGGLEGAGVVRVFLGGASGVVSAPARVFAGTAARGGLGFSVSDAGDVNGDGYGDLVISAPSANAGALMYAGVVNVFHGSASGVAEMPTLVLEGSEPSALFGHSVSNAGDVNGDGYSDLVIGASQASPSGRELAGEARVFHGSADGITRPAASVLAGTDVDGRFGNPVSGGGDYNRDGYADILVSASSASASGLRLAGAVSVFQGSASGIVSVPERVLGGAAMYEAFGYSIARLWRRAAPFYGSRSNDAIALSFGARES